jgi:Derlin-2/3
VSIWGFPVSSGNLPWALLALSILTGGDPFHDLIGIAAGHTYIYLKMVLPVSHGYDWLKTPKFLENIVNEIIRKSRGPGNQRVYNLGGDRLNLNRNNAGGAGADNAGGA